MMHIFPFSMNSFSALFSAFFYCFGLFLIDSKFFGQVCGGSHCSFKLQTPRIVSLLSESYNPHVRYGAALAVGISCAGTGLSEAISLLEPLTSDVVDFVRQGALIAMAMVMVQISEASDSRVGTFRYDVTIFYNFFISNICCLTMFSNFLIILGDNWRK